MTQQCLLCSLGPLIFEPEKEYSPAGVAERDFQGIFQLPAHGRITVLLVSRILDTLEHNEGVRSSCEITR